MTTSAQAAAVRPEHPNAQWEIPFDQAENDRYLAVQAAALARTTAG